MSRYLNRTAFVSGMAGAAAAAAMPRVGWAQSPTVLRISIPTVPSNSQNQMAARFAKLVEERSRGRLKFEIYPNGQLAKQQASIEGLQTGIVDFTLQTNAFLEPLFPHVAVLDLPFIFKDDQVAERVLDGEVGQGLLDEFKSNGIIGLTWGAGGWREFENSVRPLHKASDVAGLRIRIQNGEVYAAMCKALGATPAVIDYAETYTALAQKTVDGLEIPAITTLENKIYEVAKYMSLTNHIYNATPFVMSKMKYDAMTPDLQKIITSTAREVLPFWRKLRAQKQVDAVKELRARGVPVNEVDHASFRKAMEPLFAEFRKSIGGGLVDKVVALTNR